MHNIWSFYIVSEGRSSAGLYSLDFSVREDYRRCNRWNERLIKKGAEKYYEKPVLVVMAAGMGSRYGGLKQIDPIDREGHIIMDFPFMML